MVLDSQSPTSSRVASPAVAPSDAPGSVGLSQSAVDYDLTIVGGGIVGLTLASALKDANLRIAIVEAQPRSAAVERGQAYHINLLSSRIFEGIGVWQHMRPQVNPIDQIRLSDADYSQIVKFIQQDLGTSELGYVAEHRVILDALRAFVQTCSNVTYLCPAELTQTEYRSDQVALILNQAGTHQQVTTRLLVAADGARSPIRQQAGIATQGWQYWQSCVVAFIQPEKSHSNIAYERFWADGPFAILPLPNNLCRIVWTAPHAKAEALLQMPDAEFLSQLQHRYGDQMGQLSLVGNRSLFKVQLMQSRRYTLPRLALVGDAAHCCHPVGGQGVNLGIRDAAALAQILQQAVADGQDIGDSMVLGQYDRWRKLENWIILGFTDFLDRCFSNNFLPLVILRRLGLWVLSRVRPAKILALRLMTGLTGRPPDLAQPLSR